MKFDIKRNSNVDRSWPFINLISQKGGVYIIMMFSLFYYSCTSDNSTAKENPKTTKSEAQGEKKSMYDFGLEKNGLKLSPVKDSPIYGDAELSMKFPLEGGIVDAGNVQFDYEVNDYILGNQTADATDKSCANSKKGQHIHLILNNEPYSAFYTSEFQKELTDGHYTALAFLSRSYHESIKNNKAFILREFRVGKGGKDTFDENGEHVFYSRPKGNYIGLGNIEKIMLDFYLINTDLGEKGNVVKASINGTDFYLKEWCPYFIEGMPLGENKIQLTLLDNKGHKIPGKFNFVERTINLYKDEPITN